MIRGFSLIAIGALFALTATSSFAAGDPLVTEAATTSSTAADIFTLGAVTTPVFLCFEVTPAASLPQSSPSGTVVWEFAAESTTRCRNPRRDGDHGTAHPGGGETPPHR